MSTKLIIGLLLVPAIFVGMLLTADYAIIDVRGDGMRIVVPVPLALARIALNFVPGEARYVQVPEVAEYLPHAERIVDELRDAPDGVLVSVAERDERVLIEKVGDNIEVHVNDGDETVDVSLPFDAVIGVLRAYDGEGFDTRDLIRAAGRARGNLVHVRDGDEEVRVWIW